MSSKGKSWKKHAGSFKGRMRMFYVFKVLMDAREENNGRGRGLAVEQLSLYVIRLAQLDPSSVDFAREVENMAACLRRYRKWNYLKKVKGDRWLFDWDNWRNVKWQRKGSLLNRIEWKLRNLSEEAELKKWPVDKGYMEV